MRRRESARIVERARRRRGTHNERRPYVARPRARPLPRASTGVRSCGEYRRDRAAPRRRPHRASPVRDRQDGGEVAVAAALARGERPPPEWEQELAPRLRRVPEVRAALERMWPVLIGAELVHDLFGFAGARSARRPDGVLTPDEQALLFRERGRRRRATVAWTEADLAAGRRGRRAPRPARARRRPRAPPPPAQRRRARAGAAHASTSSASVGR